jgi:hypothetical protein
MDSCPRVVAILRNHQLAYDDVRQMIGKALKVLCAAALAGLFFSQQVDDFVVANYADLRALKTNRRELASTAKNLKNGP